MLWYGSARCVVSAAGKADEENIADVQLKLYFLVMRRSSCAKNARKEKDIYTM